MQDLKIGDEVQTLSGPKLIKWIGYNKFTKTEARPWHDSVMPVHLAPSALDDCSPRTDLYLSPLHCVYFTETLIPAKYLINGSSIARGMPADMSVIEYYHVNLGTHEVIDAEGAPVETSCDGVCGRESFSSASTVLAAVFSDLVPNNVRFAREPPGLHDV